MGGKKNKSAQEETFTLSKVRSAAFVILGSRRVPE